MFLLLSIKFIDRNKNSFVFSSEVKTYPIIDLIENTRKGEIVHHFDFKRISIEKIVLLNLNGFERNLFEIENENLLTKTSIDREEILEKKFCFDENYCLIELHFIVNDGLSYWIFPIHIVE